MIAAHLPAVYRLAERLGDDSALYRDYVNDFGQTVTVKAGTPAGALPEPVTAAEAARQFAPHVPGRAAATARR